MLLKKAAASSWQQPMTANTISSLGHPVEYIIQPVSGQAKLLRNCSKTPLRISDGPRFHLDVQFGEIPIVLCDHQYQAFVKLLEVFNLRFRAQMYQKWRPSVPVKERWVPLLLLPLSSPFSFPPISLLSLCLLPLFPYLCFPFSLSYLFHLSFFSLLSDSVLSPPSLLSLVSLSLFPNLLSCIMLRFLFSFQSQSLVEVCYRLCSSQDSREKQETLKEFCSEPSQTECCLCHGIYPTPHTGACTPECRYVLVVV